MCHSRALKPTPGWSHFVGQGLQCPGGWTDELRPDSLTGMNAAVRAVTRMGIYVGAKVFLIHEVGRVHGCRAARCARGSRAARCAPGKQGGQVCPGKQGGQVSLGKQGGQVCPGKQGLCGADCGLLYVVTLESLRWPGLWWWGLPLVQGEGSVRQEVGAWSRHLQEGDLPEVGGLLVPRNQPTPGSAAARGRPGVLPGSWRGRGAGIVGLCSAWRPGPAQGSAFLL